MDLVVTSLKWIGLGLAAILGLFIVLATFFGKRIEKQWAVRADFEDPDKRSRIGELEVQKRRVEAEDSGFQTHAKCKLRHPMLRAGLPVRVTVGDIVAMEGNVQQDGRLRLLTDAWTGNIETPEPGGPVTVWAGGDALASGALYSERDETVSTVGDDAPNAHIPRSAKILKKTNAKPAGLALIVFGLTVGYLAWDNDAAPAVLALIGILPLLGVYFIRSNTTNILYIDNGRLGWYSRFNRELHADQVPVEDIQTLKVKPYRLGTRNGGYQFVLGLVDGYEILLPENLFSGNAVRYVEKHLLTELRKLKPSIKHVQEEPVYGKPKNRIRPSGSRQ
jgi:hypothetical protein